MSLIQLDTHQHVATVTLNRPEQGNSIDLASAKEMMDVAIACSEDDNIRSVVLTGAGKAFCVGGDIKTFAADADEIGAAIKHITSYFHQAISHWVNMQKPFIGAINGVAAGGGMSLALGRFAVCRPKQQVCDGIQPNWLQPRWRWQLFLATLGGRASRLGIALHQPRLVC